MTGKIASVKPAENNVVSISLVTESDLSSVICTFPAISDPSIFRVGDEITLRGECSGFLMDVLLNNCALIIQKKENENECKDSGISIMSLRLNSSMRYLLKRVFLTL